MTPKWSRCSSNSSREPSPHENGECKSDSIKTVPSPMSCCGLPTANKVCSISCLKNHGNFYKRRKFDKDSNSLAAYEEGKETITQSGAISEDHSSLLPPIIPSEAMILSSTAGLADPILDCEEPAGVSLEPNSGMNGRCMVSSITPSFMTLDKKDAAECSSSNINPTEPITELMSPRDLCIAILRKDGLITEPRTRITTEEFTDSDANPLLACNTCGGLEHSLKMLICDSCQIPFHISCCIPSIKEVPTDEWYCEPCSLKKPEGVYGKLSEGKVKSSGSINQRPHGMSHIEYMLKYTEDYVSGARIGKNFQADVPEWSGPTSSTDGYFEDPSEFDPAELTQFNWWKTSDQNRASIGNWIQCRAILNPGDSDKEVVCGKWRRAPLYVVQSEKSDCFCCLLWDPAHADCAVPQELKTTEVQRQLKYVNMLKDQLVGPHQEPA